MLTIINSILTTYEPTYVGLQAGRVTGDGFFLQRCGENIKIPRPISQVPLFFSLDSKIKMTF
jgi:hypothetical protein